MASLREIKARIASVKGTLKITSAMKLVASAKMRRAQLAAESMIAYANVLEDIMSSVPVPELSVPEREANEDLKAASEGKTLVVAVSSNQSLCGAFNMNVIRKTLDEISKYENFELLAIGKKVADVAKKSGFVQNEDLSNIIGKPEYDSSAEFAAKLIEKFKAGEYDKVILVYNHFYSTSHQAPVAEQFLPMLPQQTSSNDRPQDDDAFILEPGAQEIIENVLPQVQKLKFFSVILDASAAEHAARTIAMQTATDNGEELLSELTLEYNKRRQEKITSEILDIVGGSVQ